MHFRNIYRLMYATSTHAFYAFNLRSWFVLLLSELCSKIKVPYTLNRNDPLLRNNSDMHILRSYFIFPCLCHTDFPLPFDYLVKNVLCPVDKIEPHIQCAIIGK